MTSFSFSVVPGNVVRSLVHEHVAELLEVVAETYDSHERGETVVPDSHFLKFPDQPDNRIIALPACLNDHKAVSGIKWIASYPGNVQRGFPRASAVMVLNDMQTGYPYACLEASLISAARTALSAILAAEVLLERRRARSLSVIGTGFIAGYVVEFLRELGWTFDQVRLHDSDTSRARAFAERHCSGAAGIELVADLRTALRSELVVFATVAATPHVCDPAWLCEARAVLHLSLRDLSPSVILAATNVVDDVEHVLKASTSLHLTEQQQGHRRFILGTLAQLRRGSVQLPAAGPRIFSPFGLGVLDLAVARFIYERALAAGAQVTIPNFFHGFEAVDRAAL